jgi:amino acid transporter
VSSLGAINGMIFTTARIYSAFGVDHRIFKAMSHWSKRWRTPVRALLIQGVVSLAIIAGVGLAGGGDPFNVTVKLTVAVFWSFFCLTGVSLIVLRKQDPDTPRPFRVPLYPFMPILFSTWCAYIVIKTLIDDMTTTGGWESLIGIGILSIGLPLYFIPMKLKRKSRAEDLQTASK